MYSIIHLIVSTGKNKLSTDINKQKMALCQYIVTNSELHGIDWYKIADTLRRISMEHLAVKISENYCQQGNASCAHLLPSLSIGSDCSSSDSSTEYLSAEEELTQTAPLCKSISVYIAEEV